jgi:RNA polymerase sigma factor (TIGR02999 family)
VASLHLKPADTPPDITQLLIAWGGGDLAAMEQLAVLLQQELHRVASRHLAAERRGHILQTTALVNEAYLRLIDWKNVRWQNRAQFFAMASQVMRHILVDYARAQRRDKRGGGVVHVSLA